MRNMDKDLRVLRGNIKHTEDKDVLATFTSDLLEMCRIYHALLLEIAKQVEEDLEALGYTKDKPPWYYCRSLIGAIEYRDAVIASDLDKFISKL